MSLEIKRKWTVKKKQKSIDSLKLSRELEENCGIVDGLFKDVDIMIKREFENVKDPKLKFCLYYSDGVTNSLNINDFIIRPLMTSKIDNDSKLFDSIKNKFVMINEVKESDKVKDIIQGITYGDSVLFIENCNKVLIMNSKSFTLRSVSEPEGEKVLAGPREGFIESMMMNLSMLRRKLRTNELKIKFQSMGKQSNTSVAVCYMDNIVDKKILDELNKRLSKIDIDGVLDSNYIKEYITDPSVLGFTSVSYTERPDIVAGKLLEGRIAIFVDGSPSVLTIPHLLIENFQSNEDYYVSSIYASLSRMVRILGFLLTITVPAIYVAVVTHHHEVLPIDLMLNFAIERQNVPLPAAIEAFVMLIMFDILRETSIRMPSYIGQALSIIGGLVIGQAAVAAKLIAAPMVIIIAFTGITNLLVPKLSAATMVTRYTLLALASCFGLLGVAFGVAIFVTHIFDLKSFGLSQTLSRRMFDVQDNKDIFIRAPWPWMIKRTSVFTKNRTRARNQQTGD